MRRAALFLSLIMTLLPVISVRAGGECEMNARLEIGKQGYVLPGDANNIRANPGKGNELLGKIPAGGIFDVLAGPVCPDNLVWWQVRYEGIEGWTPESEASTDYIADENYYLAPYTGTIVTGELTNNEPVNTPVEAVNGQINGLIGLTIPPDIPIAMSQQSSNVAINANHTELPFWMHLPAYTGLLLQDTQSYSDSTFSVQVTVFAADAYEAYYPDSVSRLRTMLAGRPADTVPPIDNLYITNAALMTDTRQNFLDLPWGSALRSIQLYTQDLSVPGSDYLYILSGLSGDGRYFVQMEARVRIQPPDSVYSIVRDPDWRFNEDELYQANYHVEALQAHATMADYINTAPDDAFSPPISVLDSIAASIRPDPNVLPPEAFTPPTDYFPPAPAPYSGETPPEADGRPYLCPDAPPTGLSVGALAQQMLTNDPVRVRTSPAGEYAGFDIPPGEVVRVIDGYECATLKGNAGVWWQIETVTGATGWIVEQYGGNAFFDKWSWN